MMLRMESLLVLLAASASAPADEAESSVYDRLEARARKLADRGPEGWARAADLYGRAGQPRGESDRAAPEDFALAARLYFYAERHEASVPAFNAAGQLFLAGGRLEAAARAFHDGACVVTRAGLMRQAAELRGWTEVLVRAQTQTQGQGQRRCLAGAARRS